MIIKARGSKVTPHWRFCPRRFEEQSYKLPHVAQPHGNRYLFWENTCTTSQSSDSLRVKWPGMSGMWVRLPLWTFIQLWQRLTGVHTGNRRSSDGSIPSGLKLKNVSRYWTVQQLFCSLSSLHYYKNCCTVHSSRHTRFDTLSLVPGERKSITWAVSV